MRLLTVILAAAGLFAGQVFSLSLSEADGIPVKDAAELVTEQTSIAFSYDARTGGKTVSYGKIELHDAPLEAVLSAVFGNSGISWKVFNGMVALFITEEEPVQEAAPKPQSRRRTVSGTVTEADGEPLMGAGVIIKGTNSGTITDFDGKWSLEAEDGTFLEISSIGFKTKEISVAEGVSTYNVTLLPDTRMLEEVVVVGYGTVKKRDLVGSVDAVSSKQFENRSNPSVSRSLQGSIPNLNISMRDGKPSRSATINVRGTGSIGSGGGALVLIDGVEGDLETVNPQDIESVSVLKDASSAAIYGARGAFGVILITTKAAEEGQIRITYNANASVNTRTIVPQVVTDGYTWTRGYLAAWDGYYNGSKPYNNTINNIVPYSDSWLQELARRSNDSSLERVRLTDDGIYEYFGNTDWHDLFYKDSNWSQEHNLSVSGGNKTANYYVSGRFYDQDGIYRVGDEKYRQYNIRAKGNLHIRPWLRISQNIDFTDVDYHQPMLYYSNQLVQRMIEHSGQPVTLPRNPDGTWTYAAVLNGYAGFYEGTTWQEEDKFTLKDKFSAELDLFKDVLLLKGDLSYLYGRNSRTRVTNMYTGHTGAATTITVNESQGSTLQNVRYDTDYLSANVYAEYTPHLGAAHSLKVLAGWNLETKSYHTLNIKRTGLTIPEKPSFALMDGLTDDPTEGGYEWSYVGVFGRVNYNWKGRYLTEFSARYDGSSKFPDNSKWGFFPSLSLGWRFSEEPFMGWASKWLDNGKIRISAGSMGNGNIDPYKYIDYMSLQTTDVVIGDALATYTSAPGAIPLSLTWETSTTYDLGLDLDMLGDRLTLGTDIYRRITDDMYTTGVALPAVFGTSSPKGNNASMRTDGWEFSIGWRDSFKLAGKDFGYSIKGMVWDAVTKVTRYINPTGSLSDYYVGKTVGEIWGYRVEGLFRDQADIDSHARQSFLQSSDKVTRPGEVKFADLNGDGVIDRGTYTLDNHGDLTVIGNTTPRYSYGINIGTDWNGWGLALFFQGIGRKNWYPRYDSGYFWGQYNRPFGYMLKAHTGSNVYSAELDNWDTAYWPKYAAYQTHQSSVNRPLSFANDRFLQNVAYIRLKNITLDYSFPRKTLEKAGLAGLKLFVSGENLWTWSPMFRITQNYDPEVINSGDSDFRTSEGDGYSYPMLKKVTLGLTLTF